VPIAKEATPEVPEGCPAEFRDAWIALDAAGTSDGISHKDATAVLGKLAEASVKPGSTPGAIRKRRTRMMTVLLEAGLLVAGEGDVYRLRS
jgi:hypothetical protein